ncbi:MAG: tetratricopeptide repeat protein [Bdellovibrionales bacterium]|nr:tetratricopeptide repeat protein [Bdellovibrionales bacterium]
MTRKKRNKASRLGIWSIILLLSASILSGCRFNYQNLEYQRAEEAAEKQQFQKALKHFDRAVRSRPRTPLALEAARKGSRIAHLETSEFITAISFYRHLILYSSDEEERIDAQKKIASVYFEKISDYASAIREYSRLLYLPHSKAEEKFFRFNIAKSYFYLNNFYQASIEMKDLLKLVDDDEGKFEYLAFRGNILLTTKKLEEAAEIFTNLMKSYPEESNRENVPLSLAVTYEEKGEFAQAVAVLEKVKKTHPSPEFIELRIKRLRERIGNLPGARGLTK